MRNLNGRRVATRALLGTSLAAIAVAGALMTPTASLAQIAGATLRGKAQPGAQMVLREVDTGAVRRATVSADGTYVVAGLQPGKYHVTVGGRAADVVLSVASTLVQNFDTPAPVSATGQIVVTGARQTAEVHTSQVNQFVTLHDIAAIPQTTRNFLEFADTVPGVQFQVDNQGNTSLRGGAQLASAVNVYIDGISQKDYVSGGSGITGSAGPNGNGDPGNPFPQLAVGEYKVITSNYSAEYGDASSAIILAQTKSGTNEFHGEAFGQFTNQDLRAKYPAEIATGTPKPDSPSEDYAADFSGPIIQDFAHFFLAYERKNLSNQSSVYPGSGITQAQATALLPSSLSDQFGPVTNPFTENLYFGKIDVEPSSKDRIELSTKLRFEDSTTGGGGQAAASTEEPYVNNDKRGDIRWQHNENNWVNEALVSYQSTQSSTTTTTASPQSQYIYYPVPNSPVTPTTLLITGGPGSGVGQLSSQKGFTLKDDFTAPIFHFLGDHSIRAGVTFSSIKLTSQNASADLANATYYYAVTSAGVAATPQEVQFPNLTAGFTSPSVTTTDKQYGSYIQDDWNVNRHLLLNLGLRWDREEVPAYLNYVTGANVVSAINGPFPGTNQSYASVLAEGYGSMPGYNINDYISNGHNRSAPNNFSPRVGFSYDVNGDNRYVLFGGYGRAYDRNLYQTLALETLKIALNGNPQVYFPSSLTPDSFGPCATTADINPTNHCYAFNPSYLTPAGLATLQTNPSSHEVDLLHNDIKTPYSDQFSLGMRTKLGDWNTQVTASYIASYDSIVGRLGNRYADGAYFQNGIQWGAQGVPGVGGLVLFDNGTKDRLFQLGVGAQKPYTRSSHWSATFSYTFSDADQTNVAGGSNPYAVNNNQYLFDRAYPFEYPFVRATAVPEHRIVATYTRDLIWGLSAAAKVELSTPDSAAFIYGCPTICNSYGSTTLFGSRPPADFLGYKDVDFQITKDITIWREADGYLRFDVLNAFNFHNYDPAAVSYPAPSITSIPAYNKSGPIIGVPLTLKVSAGVRF